MTAILMFYVSQFWDWVSKSTSLRIVVLSGGSPEEGATTLGSFVGVRVQVQKSWSLL